MNSLDTSTNDTDTHLPPGFGLGSTTHQLSLKGDLALRIEMVPTERLKPYAGNARRHSKKQIQKLARSIEQFGFLVPVLTDAEGQLITGHARVLAAQDLKIGSLPSIQVSHLSEAEQRAFRLADNRLSEDASWDPDLLAAEFRDLLDLKIDLEITGFELAEIDLTFDDAQESAGPDHGPEDDIPCPLPHPVSRSGDVWLLGDHRIMCGDARDPAVYWQLMGHEKADLVFTDPPYNVPISGHVCGSGAVQHREFVMASGEMSEEEFTSFLSSFMACARDVSRDGALHYVCMDGAHGYELLLAARRAGLSHKITCVWAKTNGGMGSFYRHQVEFVHVFKHGSAAHTNTIELGRYGRYRTTLWTYAGVNTFRHGRMDELSMHPTVKPVALVADAIKDCTRRRDLVLDPFSGSGTTIIAAEKAGRRARAIEYDPAYVDVAVRRWQDYTGQLAVHEELGVPFDDRADRPQAPSDEGAEVDHV